jgi:hypothetical protein
MQLPDYFNSLSKEERDAYGRRAKTSAGYIRTHLVAPPSRRRVPRPALMRRLAEASNGAVTYEELLAYFYGEEIAA